MKASNPMIAMTTSENTPSVSKIMTFVVWRTKSFSPSNQLSASQHINRALSRQT
jgi:hypothetical protein